MTMENGGLNQIQKQKLDEVQFFSLRHRKTILVVDMVESVRMIAENEESVVARWRRFSNAFRADHIKSLGGGLVKSLGDGMMLTFDRPIEALAVGRKMHITMNAINLEDTSAGLQVEQIFLRIGIHSGDVLADANDIYGHSANVAARIASLAAPGEIVITSAVRDQLVDGVDGQIEDLGARFVKHVDTPVQVYRVSDLDQRLASYTAKEFGASLYPTIAVLPFESRGLVGEQYAIGELIADGVIGQLSTAKSLKVISRLSTTAFRARQASVGEIESKLGANFVLSGSYVPSASGNGTKLLVIAELSSVTTNQVLWSDRFQGSVEDLLAPESELSQELARACYFHVARVEAAKVWTEPLDTLSAYSLNLSGLSLLHASAKSEFNRAPEVFQALVERHNRYSEPLVWLAKWYVMRVIRGFSDNPRADAQRALDACKRALDLNPNHATARAVMGYTLCQVFEDKEASASALATAVETKPNEMHGWLYKSVWAQHWGDTQTAVNDAQRARELSPLDPHGYFLDAILASAYTFNNEHELGIQAAKRCLKLDRNHAPAIRTMILSQYELGLIDDAKKSASMLLEVTPDLTLKAYRSMGNMDSKARQRVYAAMQAVGIN
jgi:adenylate cyclase